MKLEKFPLADTNSFSSFFLDYVQQKETLKPFYHRFPAPLNFQDQIIEKQQSFPQETRDILFSTLTRQYKDYTLSSSVSNNIEALKDGQTFTITTGHQLNIFTGPLYFIFKIVTVINTCKDLKKLYPQYNFVPVYWMASEDHDYDEIKYFKLYGKKYTWQTQQQGAVGRFSTEDISALLNEIPGDITVFREAYTKRKNLSDAARHYVNELFGEEGLVVLDGDDASLKSLLRPVIHDDVIKNVTKPIVEKTNKGLEDLGYKTQIYCRDINFFYLDEKLRSRIEKKEHVFCILDNNQKITEEQLVKEIDEHPEKFSPNVILRPLYQEIILPNIAYVGGPAEVVYWLQLKNVFKHFKVPFPMLMPRTFGMIVQQQVARTLEKTGLDLKDIFEEKNYLYNHWVLKHSPRNLTVGVERSRIMEIFENLKHRAEQVDKTLVAFVAAEGKRSLNSLEKIESKFLRAEKRLYSDKLKQIDSLKDKLFPNGSLQERSDNFLNYYQEDNQFIKKLVTLFDPFDYRFNILFI